MLQQWNRAALVVTPRAVTCSAAALGMIDVEPPAAFLRDEGTVRLPVCIGTKDPAEYRARDAQATACQQAGVFDVPRCGIRFGVLSCLEDSEQVEGPLLHKTGMRRIYTMRRCLLDRFVPDTSREQP